MICQWLAYRLGVVSTTYGWCDCITGLRQSANAARNGLQEVHACHKQEPLHWRRNHFVIGRTRVAAAQSLIEHIVDSIDYGLHSRKRYDKDHIGLNSIYSVHLGWVKFIVRNTGNPNRYPGLSIPSRFRRPCRWRHHDVTHADWMTSLGDCELRVSGGRWRKRRFSELLKFWLEFFL